MNTYELNRRQWLAGAAATATFGLAPTLTAAPSTQTKPKSVAVVVTTYQKGLHGDVLIGKILEGWNHDGGPGPALTVASMYVEQFTDRDMARPLAEKHNVPLFDTIEKALTVGGDRIPVDGVISVGEHGTYPFNDKEQHLYPRRRFFEGITETFKKYDRVVPVFNDKHLGPVWSDAKWMYDRAREMEIPFMAGSSLPVSFRKPEMNVPMDCEIEAAVGVGYSGLDIYGSHTLGCYQCVVERRRNAEQGVKSVQCLEGDAMWKAVDDRLVAKDVLDAVLAVLPKQEGAELRTGQRSALFLFQYMDGFQGTVLMLPEYVGGIGLGVKIKGQRPTATWFEERPKPYSSHFAYLMKGIECMFHTGRPSYPVERTLLTSGILDRALTSRTQQHRKLMTPELSIRYTPVDYPHAPTLALDSDPAGL
jgi:hypothetical protein